ncbi:DUF881 domain-containing protein [Bacillus paralicheniformis]|uniref:DUF881 domain-containing protein n=3 Tax=Bacillaceae TaxID=186817 RepID=A0AAW6KLI1_9BACI|nr:MULTISPECIES: DUF881 domain-containing protein [Bacillus]ETB69842.1 hypothetical protein A943_17950 [Bacillus sp. CPSM8]KJD54550.1 hypothetical protein UZ38_26835 [Bacillus amyloliquefaciens]KUL08445.1 hypothetical protein LI7559_14590 [Bacillus licheniformis LMG 7559]KUL16345.1 hypothetical protein LI6934_15675 [Bacillus licheniformis LMG 6934]MBC8622526.1 DUF881 domain-containing protein [Robertmurraya crescens]POO82967.1 DUF881 domain-containing protein [Bacillus sp. MBGLi97]
MKRHTVNLSLAMLVLGFLLSFSYQFARENKDHEETAENWKEEYSLRDRLISQEKQNKKLEQELYKKQQEVQKTETALKKEKKEYYNIVEDVERYRMFVGEIGVQGEGIKVTLKDASYIPEGENVNNYIVHESHIFRLLNELWISGAAAVSINGQRVTHHSYISCNGPVITVDGNQYPAPFVISAIGDPDVLMPALNIAGGLVDQLSRDHISVSIEKQDQIEMEPLLKQGE